MKLPLPSPKYDLRAEIQRNRILELEDNNNWKRGRDIEVNEGRLILRSPDGTRWSITVDNDGLISAASL
jgi:hypothetical protein